MGGMNNQLANVIAEQLAEHAPKRGWFTIEGRIRATADDAVYVDHIAIKADAPTVRLARYEDVDMDAPPDWYERYEKDELPNCIAFNPGPFEIADIASYDILHRGEKDGEDWCWFVTLHDKRRFLVEGGCDYTGWDCRSGASYTEVKS